MSMSSSELDAARQAASEPRASELIYRPEDRPPLPQTLFAAGQHLLAMFVAVITPALLICGRWACRHRIPSTSSACRCSPPVWLPFCKSKHGAGGFRATVDSGHQLQLRFAADHGRSGAEKRRRRRADHDGALFGTLMVASCTEILLSRVLHLARRIITPLVSGIVVMIIGLSLIQVGLTSIGGGYAAMNDHSFGSPKNLLLAGAVLAVIILLNRQRNPYLRVASLVIAMAVGYLLARAMDMLPADAPTAPRRRSPSPRRSITARASTGTCCCR